MIRLFIFFILFWICFLVVIPEANAATITNDGFTILYEGEAVESDVKRMEEKL
jgi:hypothetical protein